MAATIAIIVMASPAAAEFTENTIGCAGNATITDKNGQTYEVDANDKTATLPRTGTAQYSGQISTVTHNHRGQIVIEVGPVKTALGKWGPRPNSSNQNSKAGTKKLPSFLEQVPAGKYEVSGFHQGNEGRCAGRITVSIAGNAFDTPAGIGVAALTALTALATLFAMVATIELVFLKIVDSGTPLFMILPLVGLVLGGGLGYLGPLMRGRVSAPAG
jgi:hypothetical protein